MSLTPNQIADLLLKKISYGASDTDPARAPFEEPHIARLAVMAAQIWSDSAQIPTTAPGKDTPVLKKIVDLPLSVVPGTTASFTDPYLEDLVPFNFGDGSYNYTIKDSTGKVIPFGKNDWYLDPDSGVLTFFAGAPANMPPSISCYKYIGAKGLTAASGSSMLVVNTLNDLYPSGTLQGSFAGQLCSILDTQEIYMWTADTTVVPPVYSWAPAAGGGASGGGAAWASVSRPGTVRMSYPSASSGVAPIAVADTDPRMYNARVPRLHSQTHWNDAIDPNTNKPYATDRIPDATNTHAGLMSAQHVKDLQKSVGLPYPLDQKLHGQYVSEEFDARGIQIGDTALDVSALARARGWEASSNETTKGILVSPFSPSDLVSKIYLYDQLGNPLNDATLGQIYGRLAFTQGDSEAVPVVDDVWELRYYYQDAVNGETAYAWPSVPTEKHGAKVPQIFDLWDMPVFDPTLSAPGPVPSTVPTATDAVPGIATVGGTGTGVFAAAPNAHVFEEASAHGGFVAGLQVAGETATTDPGVVRLVPGSNVAITRNGNDFIVDAAAQVANAADATGHSKGYVQLTAEPADPTVPLALSPEDPTVVKTDRDSALDPEVYLTLRNLQLQSVPAETLAELAAVIPTPRPGQFVRTTAGDLFLYHGGAWKPIGSAHAATHLEGGTDPIALATKLAAGLMSKEDKQKVHAKNDPTALQQKKVGKIALGGSEQSVSGTTLDVTARMTDIPPATSLLRSGAVVFEPSNRARIVDAATGGVMKDGGLEVYARLTATITAPGLDEDLMADPAQAEQPATASAWTLSFYQLVGGTETPYTMPNRGFDWYYSRLYNLHDQPTFDASVEVPTGTAMAAIGDASASAKGVAMVGGEGEEAYRAASRKQLKDHMDTAAEFAHGGIIGTMTVPGRALEFVYEHDVDKSAGLDGAKEVQTLPARTTVELVGNLTLQAGENIDLEATDDGTVIIHGDRGFHPSLPAHLKAVKQNMPNLILEPGAFPTDRDTVLVGSFHFDGTKLWVNRKGEPGEPYDAWFPVGDDPTIMRVAVGGTKMVSKGMGMMLMADGKVRASEADDHGDNKAMGFIVAIEHPTQFDPPAPGAPDPNHLNDALPGDFVYLKIDGLLKGVPVANQTNAGDYLILKGGILGKAYSYGDQPSPNAIARAVTPSVGGLVDVIIVRISAGVGAGGAAKTDEWDQAETLSADADPIWPRTADSDGCYRYYLSKYPLETHDVRVTVANVRQPSSKWVLKQDIDNPETNPRYGHWYVGLKFPLQLATDAVFVDYFHA